MSSTPETRPSLLIRVRDPADRAAWQEFVEIYRPVILRLAQRKGMQAADADDIAQEVLTAVAKAVERWEHDPKRAKFRTWLQRVANNAILDALARAKPDRAAGGSSVQAVILDPHQRVVYFRELVSDRVTAIDFKGNPIFEKHGVAASALAVDMKTANLWCLCGHTLGRGETTVLNREGREIAKYPIDGCDIAYDSHDDAFWIVGKRAMKVNRRGEILCEGPSAVWTFVSIASNPRNGSVWIAQRKHPDLSRSINQLLLLDRKGRTLRKVELGEQDPMGVACDPRTGMAWAVIRGNGLLRVPLEGKPLPPLDFPATSIAIGDETGQIWIGTEKEVLRLDKDGKPVASYALGRPSSQSWISAR